MQFQYGWGCCRGKGSGYIELSFQHTLTQPGCPRDKMAEIWWDVGRNKEKCTSQNRLLVSSFLFISPRGRVALDHTCHIAGPGLWPLMSED